MNCQEQKEQIKELLSRAKIQVLTRDEEKTLGFDAAFKAARRSLKKQKAKERTSRT